MNEAQSTSLEGVDKDGHPARRLVYSKLTNLIIVPGHAIFCGHELSHARQIEHWKGTFQAGYRGNDEAQLYTEHVKAGVDALAGDPSALLLFSGGQTREEVGPFSEAQSYWYLANACDWFGHLQTRERALTEDHARDSFENLLCSIHRFRKCTGALPTRIVVCGFAFKGERYKNHFDALKQHAEAVGLSDLRSAFSYQSVNDPPYYRLHGLLGGKGSIEGEKDTRDAFSACPLGDSEDLLKKRLKRDPFCRGNPYN
jgi:hypothetical protein